MDNFCTIVCSRRTTVLCYQCELSMFSLSSKCSVLLVLVTRMMSFMQATKTSAYTRTLHSTRQDKVTLFSFLSNFFILSQFSPFHSPGFLHSLSCFLHSLSHHIIPQFSSFLLTFSSFLLHLFLSLHILHHLFLLIFLPCSQPMARHTNPPPASTLTT